MSSKEYIRNYNKQREERFKKLGVCVKCGKPRGPGLHYYCSSCQIKRNKYNLDRYNKDPVKYRLKVKERKNKLRKENKCESCGSPLIEGEKIQCINCRIVSNKSAIKGVLKYAPTY